MTGTPPSHHYGQNDHGSYGGDGGYGGQPYYGGQPDHGSYGSHDRYGEYGQYGGYAEPPSGRHHEPVELPVPLPPPARRRRARWWDVALGVVGCVALLVGVGFVVMAVIGPPAAPGGEPPAAAAVNPVTVRLAETLRYKTGTISADYVLTPGRPLTLTPSGSRPSRGAFLGLTATVTVESGSVFLTDDNFVLITTAGREFEPDVSFLFDGGLRGARAGTGQTVSGLVVWDIAAGDEAGARVALRMGPDAVQGYWQLP